LQIHKEISQTEFTYDNSLQNEIEMNYSEVLIVSMLSTGRQYLKTDNSKELGTYTIFTNKLKEYLSNPKINLSYYQSDELIELIEQFNSILILEKECDFTMMTLDARDIAINLAKNIYESCGLRLSTYIDGSIYRITDLTGNIIYENINPIEKTAIQWKVLFITLTIIITLLIIILIIKRMQIVKEEVVVSGGVEDEIFA
jgi:hypothetical protein